MGQGTKNLSPSATKVEADSAPERSMQGATCPLCFAAGTLVATEAGLRPIEEIKPGERVWAQDTDTGVKGLHPVTATVSHEDVAQTTLSVGASDGTSEQLTTTPNHPFWVEGTGWVEAGKLTAGDVLRSRADGVHLRVLSSLTETVRIQVYNLTVADAHTFYVGTLEALVHNTGSCPLAMAEQIYRSPELELLREAQRNKQFAEVRIGDNTVLYEPGIPADTSGMSLFGEEGFALGDKAFSSEEELVRTILHESHRITTSGIRDAGAHGGLAEREARSAQEFGELHADTLLRNNHG